MGIGFIRSSVGRGIGNDRVPSVQSITGSLFLIELLLLLYMKLLCSRPQSFGGAAGTPHHLTLFLVQVLFYGSAGPGHATAVQLMAAVKQHSRGK